MSPQLASFAVTPNYEIVFFACDIYEVVNILDFRDGKISLSTIISQLENSKIGGESNSSEILSEILFKYTI